MEGIYPVTFAKQSVGKVQVLRQGLYYRIICRCQLSGQVICRLMVSSADRMESLGIVVPMDGGFGLEKRIPVKHLWEGEAAFALIPKLENTMGKFYPIYPDEPFSYIARLKEAYLTYREGQAGVLLMESSKPTGQ